MAVHVAILLKRYVQLILAGTKTIESRLTKTSRVPYQAIAPGDRIYFKCSAGPYMATAIADSVAFYADLTRADVDRLKHQYNKAVCGDDAYWQWKRDSRYATMVTLRDVQAISIGPTMKPSQGIAWFVLPGEPACVTLTGGAIRNRYVRAPKTMCGQVQLLLPDGRAIDTDVRSDHLIRWRGWGSVFQSAQASPGDQVTFEPLNKNQYRVSIITMKPERTTALSRFISRARLNQLIRRAKAEDLGPPARDITSEMFVPKRQKTTAQVCAREPGILSGGALLEAIINNYDPKVTLDIKIEDGKAIGRGDVIAQLTGSLRSILTIERVALNFLTHLSGIATLTSQYVKAAGHRSAKIYDTRKTLPGLRGLEKYAVTCGGGFSHRIGLYDAVLVKDNHLAHVPAHQLQMALGKAIRKARRAEPPPEFIEVEVDTLEQFGHVLTCDVDVILLDNMTLAQLRGAVTLRNKQAPKVQLEASGGVTLQTVHKIASTDVDRIAVGAITHSAPALDIALDIRGDIWGDDRGDDTP